ncbi:MAG: DUF3494 domain-containing protein [Sphingobacteriales bacterium]|nr:MAG: DUF3494 domain-containing protein [Sphingobacteriales bacterium]
MNKNLPRVLAIILLITLPNLSFGQAPALGTAASYAVFTNAGAFNNLGATDITGDIGTHVGAFSGFPPGTVTGQTHVADATSAQVMSDVFTAYSALAAISCSPNLVTPLTSMTLTPGVYCTTTGNTSWVGNLTLNAQGNPNALFIIKTGGALSTAASSNIVLVNGASASNVYFRVNGAVELGAGSTFYGTIIAEGAIEMLEGAFLQGRVLSTAGAISLHNNRITSLSASACNCPH